MITTLGTSDVGLERSHNEDAFFTGDDGGVAVVADRVGGVAAGEGASRIFVETAAEVIFQERVTMLPLVEAVPDNGLFMIPSTIHFSDSKNGDR